MRWLCDKSLGCSPALPPGRVPHVRGLSRTWGTRPGGNAWWEAGKAEDGMKANPLLFYLSHSWLWFLKPEGESPAQQD